MSKFLTKIITVILAVLIVATPVSVFAEDFTVANISFEILNTTGTVTIEPINGAPLPNITRYTDVSNGTFSIVYFEPGNYLYRVYQTKGTENNVKYDNTIYNVLVSVVYDNNDRLIPIVSIAIEGEMFKKPSIVFENTIEKEPDKKPDKEPDKEPEEEIEIIDDEPEKKPDPQPNVPDNPPQTGDESNLVLWIVILGATVIGIAVVAFICLKNKTKKE